MALVLADRIRETTLTSGLDTTVALDGAVSAFRQISGALDDGDTMPYLMQHTQLPSQWEVGTGTLIDANTFERTTVMSSSNGNALVNFSAGLKQISLSVHAALLTQALTPLTADDIPALPASKIASGVFDEARIPDLSGLYSTPANVTSQINAALTPYATAAQIAATYATPASVSAQIAAATIQTSQLNGDLDYSRINGTGPFADQFIPNLNASKINAGDLALARIATALAAGGGPIAGSTGTFTSTLAIDTNVLYVDTASDRVGLSTSTPSSTLDVTVNNLGVTPANASGIALINTTAAAVGAQQISPALRWQGQGWKTDATAASRPIDFVSYLLPVQGTANPTAQWLLRSSVNSGAYASRLAINSDAGLTTFESAGLRIQQQGNGIGGISFNGSTPVSNTIIVSPGFIFSNSSSPSATGQSVLRLSSAASAATSGTTNLWTLDISFAPTSGTGIFHTFQMNPTVNQTGGANGITRGIYINPTLTAAADWRSLEIANNAGWGVYQSNATPNNLFVGKMMLGTASTPTAQLDINSDILRLRTAKTPASAAAAGNAGDFCWDATHLYICVSASTWRRVAHASW